MDIKQVERVVKLVESSQLHEVTIADNGQSIKVVNSLGEQSNVSASPIEATPTHETEQTGSDVLQVGATYVGQVYLSEDDATDNLVKEGDHIQKGQTICFIDELTRLQPVISNKEGVVTAVLVESGQNVEYGQPIFELKTVF
ncbi:MULTISPECIES: acetyl-CoA carboxylase biotin carboxyl carrier protein [unclassified Psychrobacter]|uniref:acetyl-CoA carboxylase biotin carboxyl carrier protein n=1 Tax=unclassified Psychrobacter TaxID=196806 RepID=UPI001788896A|nr:acetyl-CoA carboxylase biotin carboxyl carrier protein subunit [Psychrobacter sp. FME13]MBE0441740.1 acetyl-CoA carboxylase biotin carboxyl carrier protein subunit [Psychrobacter sp. FME13]